MIWAWTKHAIKENPATFILVFTILIGWGYDYLPIPEGKVYYWNGSKGPSYAWYYWITINYYFMGFVLILGWLLPKKSSLDKQVIASYFIFDVLGFLSYQYQGWPNPHKERIIIGFCLSVLILILLRIWKLMRS